MSEENITELKNQGRRGRPLGLKLSEETKDKIRHKRIGKAHTEKTKDKISESMHKHFKSRDLLTESLAYDYRFSTEEVLCWIDNNEESINNCEEVLTNKRISYANQIEQPVGVNIDQFFGHNMTPEFILLLKEELLANGLEDLLAFIKAVLE